MGRRGRIGLALTKIESVEPHLKPAAPLTPRVRLRMNERPAPSDLSVPPDEGPSLSGSDLGSRSSPEPATVDLPEPIMPR